MYGRASRRVAPEGAVECGRRHAAASRAWIQIAQTPNTSPFFFEHLRARWRRTPTLGRADFRMPRPFCRCLKLAKFSSGQPAILIGLVRMSWGHVAFWLRLIHKQCRLVDDLPRRRAEFKEFKFSSGGPANPIASDQVVPQHQRYIPAADPRPSPAQQRLVSARSVSAK